MTRAELHRAGDGCRENSLKPGIYIADVLHLFVSLPFEGQVEKYSKCSQG
jgi:hypothetical protein